MGSENIFDSPKILDAYFCDQSFVPSMKPCLVVKPKSVVEVQGIVNWANKIQTPLVPISSGPPHFYGDTVPIDPGAVMVDLSEMKRIIRVDPKNKMVLVEPGVSYGHLQAELAKDGLTETVLAITPPR